MSLDILYRDMSVTYCTRIWLLSWMSLLLILKPTCFKKCLTTYFTGICLWHTVQGYGFSPERVFCWSLNLHALENVSRHSLQGYVCTSIWLLSWMSLLLILKPTCFRKCLMTYFTGICLWYTVQGYGFSPERVFCWSLILHALKSVSRHSLQGYVSRKWLLPKKDFSPKDGVSPETSTETFVLDLDVYQMIQIN